MLPAFQPNPEFAVGLNLSVEEAAIVEERPVTPIVSLTGDKTKCIKEEQLQKDR